VQRMRRWFYLTNDRFVTFLGTWLADNAESGSKRRKVVLWLGRRPPQHFPGILSKPLLRRMFQAAHGSEVLATWRARDAIEMADFEMPPSERIVQSDLWIAELYTPSTATATERRLRALNWGNLHVRINPADWFLDVRGRTESTGTLSLGLIARKGSSLIGVAQADLPASFEMTAATLVGITSTVTALIVQFTLTDEAAGELERVLRSPYQTGISYRRGAYSILTPPQLQASAATEVRRRLRNEAASWVRAELPGVFAAGTLGGVFPTVELITTAEQQPFQGFFGKRGWADSGGLRNDLGTWISITVPSLRARLPASVYDEDDRYALVLAGIENDLIRQFSWTGHNNARGISAGLGNMLDSIVSSWALLALLDGWRGAVSAARDVAERDASGRSPVRSIKLPGLDRLRHHDKRARA